MPKKFETLQTRLMFLRSSLPCHIAGMLVVFEQQHQSVRCNLLIVQLYATTEIKYRQNISQTQPTLVPSSQIM